MDTIDIANLTAEIVEAYVSSNQTSIESLPTLIGNVYVAIAGLTQPAQPVSETVALVPAVPVKKSVTSDAIFSLIDGKPRKMLRKHLTLNGYTPDSYRAAFGLKSDYPMVSANYAATRSAMALKLGLGRKPGLKVVAA